MKHTPLILALPILALLGLALLGLALLGLALPILALLAGCAAQPPGDPGVRGFLWGLWDGAIAPISFIVSLFKDGIRIYALPNSGGWYDFGYLIGLTCWAGGSHAARRRN